VIKRIHFVTRSAGMTAEDFASGWPSASAGVAAAPEEVRPSRVTVCTTLPELTGPDPLHDGIGVEWFTDATHLARFASWLRTDDGRAALAPADGLVDATASPVVVAEEVVLRGADWLEERWLEGGPRLKHMAVALRSADLTSEEFSQRWRSHAGRVGGSTAPATVIPDAARGLAYVQDHPRPRPSGEWAYDALNEVWFDDLDGLRARLDWFGANPPVLPDDLFRASWFLAAREELVAG
jgi:hypothetical protein